MALSIGLRKASTVRALLVHGIIISAVMGSPPASVCFSREISLQTRAFLVITEETQCYCFLHSFGSGFPSTSVDGWLHRAIQTVHPKKGKNPISLLSWRRCTTNTSVVGNQYSSTGELSPKYRFPETPILTQLLLFFRQTET